MASIRKRVIPLRSLIIVAVCIAAWGILLGRLFYLQILSYDRYKVSSIDNISRETSVSAQRGIIYDRNMVQLATNSTVWRAFISPRDIENIEETDDGRVSKEGIRQLVASGLSQILDVSYPDILEKLTYVNRADVTIKKDLDEETSNMLQAFIDENNLGNYVHIDSYFKRYYPYGKAASHVIGIVGTDGGLLGLEYQYDTELTGTVGRYVTAKNARGKRIPFKYDSYIEATNGYNVISTIDLTTQSLLEEQLEKTYYDSQANNRVTGIVMDVNSFAVLAMATYPDFDLNDPYQLDADSQYKLDTSGYISGSDEYRKYYNDLLYTMWRNKAVSEVYEPGSTFKIITTSMALEEKLVTIDEEFTCTGSYFVEGYNAPIHCHRLGGHGTASFAWMLQQSCNPTLMTVAGRIGRTKFYEYYQAYGYTDRTGIDLPGEAKGIFHALSAFNQVELAVYSFGQTFKTTPLQQLTAICTVANGGRMGTPHLVSALTDDEGNVIRSFDTQIKRQVVSEEVCDIIAQVLEEGVSGDGGAKNAYVSGYKVAAKTGTSEVRDILDENGESYLRVGSCVAFAPADDPQIAVLIMVDQPQISNMYGSIVAAPYIADFLDDALPYYGVERHYTAEEEAKRSVSVINYVGWPLADATANIKAWGINCKVVGEVLGDGSDIVTFQMPSAGNYVSKVNGRIVLYTGNAAVDDYEVVPNVIGMTATNASRTLLRRGFNIQLEGAQNYDVGTGAVVVSQDPVEGESALYGSIVTVVLRYLDGTAN